MDIEQVFNQLRWPLKPYQRDYFNSQEKHRILFMGRKCGKSVIMCADSADKLDKPGIPGMAFDGGILTLSRGQTQAVELLAMTKMMLEVVGWTFSSEQPDISLENKVAYASTTRLLVPAEGQKFPNRLLALPCGHRADNLAPWSFHDIKYDEADFLPDDIFARTAACGAVHDATITLASNPNKFSRMVESYFYKAVHSGNWKVWQMKTKDAEIVPMKWLYEQKKLMSKEDYEREFNLSWGNIRHGYYNMQDTVLPCLSREPIDKQLLLKTCPTMLGVDFARFGEDDNVIAFASWDGNKAYVWVDVIGGRQRTTFITGAIAALFKSFPQIKKVITDETGIGAGPTDSLVQQLGRYRVIGVENHRRVRKDEGRRTRMQKVDLHSNFIRLMENGLVCLDYDRRIIHSIASVQHKFTETGEISLKGRDDHICEAIVRALMPLMQRLPTRAPILEVMENESLSSW